LNDQTPAVVDVAPSRLAKRMVLDIAKDFKVQRRYAQRLNTMHLLKTVQDYQGRSCKLTEVSWSDHPQIQLLLERRDKYLAAMRTAELARSIVEDPSLRSEDRAEALSNLAHYERIADGHLSAMETILKEARKDALTYTKNMSALLGAAANLVEDRREHDEKMELERLKVGRLSDLDLAKMEMAEAIKEDDHDASES